MESVRKKSPSGVVLTPVSLAIFHTQHIRDETFKKITDSPLSCGSLKVSKGKTALQIARNSNMIKAKDALNVHIGSNACIIKWKFEPAEIARFNIGTNDRGVLHNGQLVFLQRSQDISGTFASQFKHVKF